MEPRHQGEDNFMTPDMILKSKIIHQFLRHKVGKLRLAAPGNRVRIEEFAERFMAQARGVKGEVSGIGVMC